MQADRGFLSFGGFGSFFFFGGLSLRVLFRKALGFSRSSEKVVVPFLSAAFLSAAFLSAVFLSAAFLSAAFLLA